MNALEQFSQRLPEIENKIGYTFQDKFLLTLAFAHRSFINEHRNLIKEHNERLEFLGDSVLGLLIAEYLYLHHPLQQEGELSNLRSRLVEATACASYVQRLSVADYLLLGRGERMSEGRGRESILADLFEALIGAIFLDGGMQAAKEFFFGNFSDEIQGVLGKPQRNWKAELQDYAQKIYQQIPDYRLLHEAGPDHSKEFCISVWINQREFGQGKGHSKKEAQQAAAEDAITKLNNETS